MGSARLKWMTTLVYGSRSTPLRTVQPCEPGLIVIAVRSRRRMSFRVSQPLCPPATVTASVHAGPNWARLYSVFGARPLMGRVASPARAVLGGGDPGDVEGAGVALVVGALLGAGALVVDGLAEGGWTCLVAARLLAVVTFPHEVTAPADAIISASAGSTF